MPVVPMVIEQSGRGERVYDIFSLLLRHRIIFLGTPIDDNVANLTIAQLLFLEFDDPERDILMYINCPGGVVAAGLAIYDTMQYIQPDVSTYCMGMAASMGALLLAGGAHGKRFALPYSRVLIHQPWGGGISGRVSDIEITAREFIRTKDIVNNLLSEHTGQPLEKVQKDTDRDFWMSPGEALEYGLIDEVLSRKEVRRRTREAG